MKKKAILSADFTWYLIRFLFLIIMMIVVIMIIKAFIITTVDIDGVQARIMQHRLLYSKSGISMYDAKIDRIYPGIIDSNRIDEVHLDEALFMDPNYIMAGKITLKYADGTIVKEAYFNKKWYERLNPLSLTGMQGTGGADSFEYETYVLIATQNPGVYQHGILVMSIVIGR